MGRDAKGSGPDGALEALVWGFFRVRLCSLRDDEEDEEEDDDVDDDFRRLRLILDLDDDDLLPGAIFRVVSFVLSPSPNSLDNHFILLVRQILPMQWKTTITIPLHCK